MKFWTQEENIDIKQLTKSELIELLQLEGEMQQSLFQKARVMRRLHGTDKVMLRGVMEISNYCQKNCDYCAMRAANKGLERYRLSAEEILYLAEEIKKTNIISTIFLQSGQDPNCDPILEEVIPELRKLNLNVLLCLGERPREVYSKFAELGADSYILKFETSNPDFYKEIAYTSLQKRLQCLSWLQEAGFKVGTGNIVGLPNQTLDTLAEDILLAIKLQPDFVSSSPFIPNQNTPLEKLSYGNINYTLNTMAIYRLALPSALIPTVSALEKIQKHGQLMGLNAGANVLTINFTPTGYRQKFRIYSEKRFVVSLDHALKTIEEAGLQVHLPSQETSLNYSLIS
ncbi:MAG: radical SAM protein [Desmonostoc vinosum HA7617-LM4]|jgi:biotin synthase|nr:radical SAM protein [Desmonostoc vinosum HA7617-LM4]